MDWVRTLNQAIQFIECHLEENITSEDIAAHVYISPFHFQRAFSLLTGITVKEYIRNRRMSLAGMELVSRQSKVIDLALKYGYETPESFTRAFQRYHGILPSQAKQQGINLKSFNPLTIKIVLEGGCEMDYKIEKKEAMKIVAMVRRFETESSAVKIPDFWTEYFSKGWHDQVCGMMGICIQMRKESESYEYAIGCPAEYVKEVPEGFEVLEIPAYTWAVFKCVGSMPDSIQDMWGRVYQEWLPTAEYELVQDYDIELYTEGDNNSDDYVSYVWLPVREKK